MKGKDYMKYQANLLKMSVHPMFHKLFKKLNNEEMAAIVDFLKRTEEVDNNQYAHLCNRWYLDQAKPRNYNDMWAIVTQVRNI